MFWALVTATTLKIYNTYNAHEFDRERKKKASSKRKLKRVYNYIGMSGLIAINAAHCQFRNRIHICSKWLAALNLIRNVKVISEQTARLPAYFALYLRVCTIIVCMSCVQYYVSVEQHEIVAKPSNFNMFCAQAVT